MKSKKMAMHTPDMDKMMPKGKNSAKKKIAKKASPKKKK